MKESSSEYAGLYVRIAKNNFLDARAISAVPLTAHMKYDDVTST